MELDQRTKWVQDARLVRTTSKYYFPSSGRTWILHGFYGFSVTVLQELAISSYCKGPTTEGAPDPGALHQLCSGVSRPRDPHRPSDAPRGLPGHSRRRRAPSYPRSHMGRSRAMVLWKTKKRTKARGWSRRGD